MGGRGRGSLFWGCDSWREGTLDFPALEGWHVVQNDMAYSIGVRYSASERARGGGGNFTNGKQMCHTSQLLSLSISALLALFSFLNNSLTLCINPFENAAFNNIDSSNCAVGFCIHAHVQV